MISDICQKAIDKDPDMTKVEDIHKQCSEILPSGEKCGLRLPPEYLPWCKWLDVTPRLLIN